MKLHFVEDAWRLSRAVAICALICIGSAVAALRLAAAEPAEFNVRDYGAVGDGVAADTAAIRRALADCRARGGGTVRLPPGTYLSGGLELGSNTTLQIDAGAVLRGSPDLGEYRLVGHEGPWEVRALILAENAENVAVVGQGTIDGNHVFDGPRFAQQPKIKHPDQLPGWIWGEWNRGPHTIAFHACRHGLVRDLLIEDSANYAVRLRDSREIVVNHVRTRGGWDGVNTVRCRDVTITDCHIESGDDAVAAWVVDQMVVSNCILNSSTAGFRVASGVRHFVAANCLVTGPGKYPQRTGKKHDTECGIYVHAFPPQSGENAWLEVPVEDIQFSNISIRGVRRPFQIGIVDGNKFFRDVSLNDITARGCTLPGLVEGGPHALADRIALRNVHVVNVGGGAAPARLAAASALECRNIANLALENIVLETERPDPRPALVCRNIRRLRAPGVELGAAAAGAAPIELSEIGALSGWDSFELPLVPARVRAARFSPDRPIAGEPFTAVAELAGGDRDELAQLESRAGGTVRTLWRWLPADKTSAVKIDGLTLPTAGAGRVEIGGLAATLAVQSRPAGARVEWKSIVVAAEATPSRLVATVELRNIGAAPATVEVPLQLDGNELFANTVRVPAGETTLVRFPFAAEPGRHVVGTRGLPPTPFDVPGPVQPPYRVAGPANQPGCLQFVGENRFHIAPALARGRFGDEHDTIYRAQGLPPDGDVTVSITEVFDDHWAGRAGLVVSRDAADPAAAGYLVLAVSPSFGCSLQWDADGDGVLDHHTPFAGFTHLPTRLRLERRGAQFTGYCKAGPGDWVKVGSATVASAQGPLDAGMFACLLPASFADFAIAEAAASPAAAAPTSGE